MKQDFFDEFPNLKNTDFTAECLYILRGNRDAWTRLEGDLISRTFYQRRADGSFKPEIPDLHEVAAEYKAVAQHAVENVNYDELVRQAFESALEKHASLRKLTSKYIQNR